ncbi:MAG TPA: TRAP transporter substrate-binding protein [Candidatus Acidoferrales bacterium]|nr:TRAP transporter substrate-binding protein [Candidatus Acidoferrales bacterium]
MKKTLSRGTFAAGSASIFASIGIVRAPAKAAQFSWKWGHDLAVDHPMNVRGVEAFAKIKQETNGALEIRAFPNSTLGGDPAMLSQLRSGAIEILNYPGGFLDTIVPIAAIENIAYAFKTRDLAFAAMDGQLGAIVRSEITNKTGIVVLDKIWENGYREITSGTKPIRTVDDLKGFKIRVSPGKIRIDTFQSLGASPTPIAISELYTALQTKIVEGQENPLLNIETQRMFEVQKYCAMSNHMWTGYWTLINPDKWKALPANYQAVVRKYMTAATLAERRDNAVINVSLRDKLSRQGLIFNEVQVQGFRNKLKGSGYYERWSKEFGPQAWALLEKYAQAKLG